VADPCSKLAFSDWWQKTAGDRWLRLPGGALDHRRLPVSAGHRKWFQLSD